MSLKPSFDPVQLRIVETFLKDSFRRARKETSIVAMSGGLDSSVTATLCVRTLGAARVQGLFLGEGGPESADLEDARALAESLDMNLEEIDISPMVGAFREQLRIEDRVALGNVKARCRMIVSYCFANLRDGLVVGTGNKSELMVGYTTKFGDGGVDLLPLGDLYKTQVREMGKHLELPERIIRKVPSAGLWKGQTDEEELGLAYDDLDRILLGLELEMADEDISHRTGLPVESVRRVEEMVKRSVHKRKMPLIPKIGIRTVGLDWRE